MPNSYFTNPAVFLIETVFELAVLVVLLRLLLQWVRADFHNPVSQFVVRVTQPVLAPLRRALPPAGKVDTASVVLLFAIKLIELALISFVMGGRPERIDGLILHAFADLLGLAMNVFLFSILIQVVLSWVNPAAAWNPMTRILYSLTEPLLVPARRLLPPMGGFDFSPIIVLVGLQLAKMLILPPLYAL